MEKLNGGEINGIILIAFVAATYYLCAVSPKGVAEDLRSLSRGIAKLIRPITHAFINKKSKRNS